jgi:hypothetical protein
MTGNVIILEGPDAVGKTTLAGAIVEQMSRTKMIRSGPPDPMEGQTVGEMYVHKCREIVNLAMLETNVVVDRLHLGEQVYGPIMRGKSRITAGESYYCDMVRDTVGAARMLCTLSAAKLVARSMKRDGGAADEKSGAAIGHALPIRAAFNHFGWNWHPIEMMGYPNKLASTCISQTSPSTPLCRVGQLGREHKVVYALPDEWTYDKVGRFMAIIKRSGQQACFFHGGPLPEEIDSIPDVQIVAVGSAYGWIAAQHIVLPSRVTYVPEMI